MADNGGRAFPSQAISYTGLPSEGLESGMTLRDYFAGQSIMRQTNLAETYEGMAKSAYQLADAMIKERNK